MAGRRGKGDPEKTHGQWAQGLGVVGALLLLLGAYSIITGDPVGLIRLFTWGGQSSGHMAGPKGIYYCILGCALLAYWIIAKRTRK